MTEECRPCLEGDVASLCLLSREDRDVTIPSGAELYYGQTMFTQFIGMHTFKLVSCITISWTAQCE